MSLRDEIANFNKWVKGLPKESKLRAFFEDFNIREAINEGMKKDFVTTVEITDDQCEDSEEIIAELKAENDLLQISLDGSREYVDWLLPKLKAAENKIEVLEKHIDRLKTTIRLSREAAGYNAENNFLRIRQLENQAIERKES